MPHCSPVPAVTDTRTRFLDSALRVLRQRGYAATRVDDLCAATGLSKGAFFHHFPSKEALALAAADHFHASAEAVFAGLDREHAAPRDWLLAYVDLRVALLDGDLPDVTCLLGTVVQETYETHPGLSAVAGAHIETHAASIAEVARAAKAQHAPDAMWDPGSLGRHVLAVVQGAFVLAKATGSLEVAVESLRHLRRYLELLLPTSSADAD